MEAYMNFDRLAQLISPKTILDLGCNRGNWHNEARLRWPDSRFYLVDGNEECRADIQKTGAEYSIAILSDREKEVVFYTRKNAPGCTGASLYRENTPFYEGENAVENKLQATTLDKLVGGRGFELIKADLQSGEIDCFKGGTLTLSKAKWVVMEVSLSDYNEGAPQADEVYEFMRKRDFYAKESLGDITHPLDPTKVIQQDILFTREN